jgi:flagellar protein FliS
MTPRAGSDSLETEVLTATPQRLHLMLIEAAIRSTSQARHHFAAQNREAGLASVLRAQTIMGELLAGLQPGPDDDLTPRVAAIYLFIYRSLIAANLEYNVAKLDDALRVLETQRETWRSVCELLGSQRHEDAASTSLAGTSFEA